MSEQFHNGQATEESILEWVLGLPIRADGKFWGKYDGCIGAYSCQELIYMQFTNWTVRNVKCKATRLSVSKYSQ